MNTVDSQTIAIDQLGIGHYVHLDLKWFEHPFAFSQFKIKSQEQIRTLRELGLQSVRINLELSDAVARARSDALPPAAPSAAPSADNLSISPVMQKKRAMMEQMRLRREDAARIEGAFVDTVEVIRDIERNMYSQPQETLQRADRLVKKIADSILSAPELAIQVMADKLGGEDLYFHSLNVTMLSIMIARDLKMPPELAGVLGIGALMHDIGRKDVPDKILLKTEALTQAERNFYELHCHFGVELGHRLNLAPAAIAIIREHHELYDGTGFPAKLKGDAINPLARIVVIANYYDELCNPPHIADAMTPHEALSLMYAKLRGKFDPKMLQVLIRCLGVYPPGSIVQLSNGAIGMVVTVNTARPMKPAVMVYDAAVPKEEAIVLDLERETEFNIAKAIAPRQVPRDVYNYLSPRKRISYYFDASKARREVSKP